MLRISMNSIIHLLIALGSLLFILLGSETQLYPQIEAESGSNQGLTLMESQGATQGTYLHLDEKGTVTWSVQIPQEGYYDIIIRYRASDGDKEQILLKNDIEIPIGFGMAEDWALFSQPFFLKEGTNSLGLKESWGYQDLDWIKCAPATVTRHFVPHHLTFYKNHPDNPTLKVDNFHDPIQTVTLDDQPLRFTWRDYPFQERAIWLELESVDLKNLPVGEHSLSIQLKTAEINGKVTIQNDPQAADLMILAPDVSHGSSVFMRLPSGRNLLIDCGQDWVRDGTLIPLFERHEVDTIHVLILTHYHRDHDSGDRGKTMINRFNIQEVIDYQTHYTGYEWDQDGVHIKILNSYEDGNDENRQSMAMKIQYGDFIYIHDADIYEDNQQRIMADFPNDLTAQVYYANHHFHGSVYPPYIQALNPDVVIIQAQEAIYARHAYMVKYIQEVENVLNTRRKTPVATLFPQEVGTVVIRVNKSGQWEYFTRMNGDTDRIPGW